MENLLQVKGGKTKFTVHFRSIGLSGKMDSVAFCVRIWELFDHFCHPSVRIITMKSMIFNKRDLLYSGRFFFYFLKKLFTVKCISTKPRTISPF